jgi:hypothetical protein
MNPSVLIDITQIPTQLSGLISITNSIAVAMLAFIIPYTLLELNVQAMGSKAPPSYGSFLVRVLVALACLLAYQQLYTLFLTVAQAMSFAVLSEQDWGNFLVKSFSAPDAQSPILSWLTHPLNSVQAIILFLSSLIAVTAKDVVIMLQACFLSLLFAFGPIAIVCAISERTAAVTRGWIANSFQIALWSFFLRLVVLVWLTLNPLSGNTGTGWANDFLGILTVNISFLVMVLGTPILTARLISGESIAAFGEMAVGTMQAVSIGGAMKAGRFLGQVAERHGRGGPGGRGGGDQRKSSDAQAKPVQHSTSSTATAAHDRLFGHKQEGGEGKVKPDA